MASSPLSPTSSNSVSLLESESGSLPVLNLPHPSTTYLFQDQLHLASSRPLPRLPIEVLEKILKNVFLRPTQLLPTSDPFNLNGTSHLLLVSKGFRELCSPIFYQSVTITRPSHYVAFFNPEHGLFGTGEEGEKRWSFVRELSIAIGIEPPLSSHSTSSCLAALHLPSGRTLQRVCLLHRAGQRVPRSENPCPRVLHRLMQDPGRREAAMVALEPQRLADVERDPATYSGLSLDQWIKEKFWIIPEEFLERSHIGVIFREVETNRATFLHNLVQSNQPSSLMVGNEAIRSYYIKGTATGAVAEELTLFSDWADASHNVDPFRSFIKTFNSVLETRTVHLVGFNVDFIRELEEDLKKDGIGQGWSYERSDGNRCSLFLSEELDVVEP
ncbi:hypothetical protein BDY24DRAFT_414244 [Mrakia frigida]|uniref:uncharacterized protein n=1 Tax=Mrakia frigida TaxID=29902 RepID=UPI003FCBF74B